MGPRGLRLMIALALIDAAPVHAQEVRTFQDDTCGVAFQFPSDWEVGPPSWESAEPCTFMLRPAAWDSLLVAEDSVDFYTTTVRIVDGEPTAVAETLGFSSRPEGWVITGRAGAETPGDGYARDALYGVTGFAASGCYRLGGSYQGLCDAPSALLGHASRTAAIRGGPAAEAVVELIVETIELRE